MDCNYVNENCKWCGDKKPSEGLAYVLSTDGTYYIVAGIGNCAETDIVIPKTYKSKPVSEISSSAFYENDFIITLKIPS